MATTPTMANLSRRKRRQISPHSERCSMSSASGLHMPVAPTAVPISEVPETVESESEVDLGLGLQAADGLVAPGTLRRDVSSCGLTTFARLCDHGEVVLAGADVRVGTAGDEVARGPVAGRAPP